ncbi:Uncharacterized protein dnl_30600 [Desulfonema limicola]|uniref:Uncharacterized protein n=1 Tax=Desulfonema limicola TaxID=45656 RepID=A0A975B8R9_9BACT|nr:Uncharacterized protein dnl_30600 [Desulfonema limicola]
MPVIVDIDEYGFNPCFHGSTTVRKFKLAFPLKRTGFNPCFHGSTTVSGCKRTIYDTPTNVSILVFMEVQL